MVKLFRPYYPVLAAVLLCMPHAAPGQQKTIKQAPPRPTVSISGKDLYREYCAVCHGIDARGGGPAADALKVQPTDLTLIARSNGGRFPEERMLKMLHGDQAIVAHGTADMPVWGKIFSNMSSSPDLAETRVHALLDHLESLQAR